MEAAVHLAADSLVGESMADPANYCCNNVANGIGLLGALLACGVRRFIFSSTAAVYGEPDAMSITEEHPTRPVNIYEATKLMFEQVLEWYDRAYGLRYVSLRYFNAAGADDSGDIGEDHRPETQLVPIVLQAALGWRGRVGPGGRRGAPLSSDAAGEDPPRPAPPQGHRRLQATAQQRCSPRRS